MAISTFLGLETALRGILAQQRAIDVTGHNISNVATPGYSRQTANLVTTQPMADTPAGLLGTGVDVQSYQRIRDSYIDVQLRAQTMLKGYAEAQQNGLSQVELSLNEPSDTGLSALLGKYWAAWQNVANAPEDVATRQALAQSAASLANGFNSLASQITTVQSQTTQEQSLTMGQVNSIGTQIASLTGSIKAAELAGQQPNDLLDKRDLLLDKLSNLAQVSVTDLGDGTIEVEFGDAAAPLVSETTVNWPQALTEPQGKLGALIELASPTGRIASYRTELNAFAQGLAESVNAVHTSGGGPAFFSFTAGSAAATLAVNVTAGEVQTTATGTEGGNDIAVAIGALRGGGPDQAYASFVSRIGTDMSNARRLAENSEVLVNAVQERRESTSGVSLDEEMTNLVRFQRAYQASARAMTTFDEALNTLINHTGRVGL